MLPYPEVAVKDVHMHVRQGNRPKQPRCVPDKVYAIMLKCWNRDRRTRWTFSSLRRVLERELSVLDPPMPERDIGAFLQDVVRHYRLASLFGPNSKAMGRQGNFAL